MTNQWSIDHLDELIQGCLLLSNLSAKCIVKGKKSWVFSYFITLKAQTFEWVNWTFRNAKKCKF
jgi:hypothetical protein